MTAGGDPASFEALVEDLAERAGRQLAERSVLPRATCRLQMHRGRVGFAEAAALVPYLADLGTSHLYLSPIQVARAGSTHGYDVVDHDRLDPALGGDEGFRALVDTLHAHGMGLILDVVPDHMGIVEGNRRWNGVLENGPSSPDARWFDIDWRPLKPELRDRVLLPLLGGQYGRVLESGEIRIGYDAGGFHVRLGDVRLPTDPRSYAQILQHRLDAFRESVPADDPGRRELESILTALEYLPSRSETDPDRVAERQREKEVVKERLRRLTERSSQVAAHVRRNVDEFNGTPDDPASFGLLDAFLDAQPYRLAHWKSAADEINYRRFFDVNELAAICTENPEAFEASHRLVFELLARGDADGLRIDHIDGLADPSDYAWRLQRGYLKALVRRAGEAPGGRPVPAAGRKGTAQGGSDGEAARRALADAAFQRLWARLGGPPGREVEETLRHDKWLPRAGEDSVVDVSRVDLHGGRLPLLVLVEKILEPHEQLPAWPVSGTTGYDFLNLANGLFVDPDGLRDVARCYATFTGRRQKFPEIAHQCKLLILDVALAGELQLIASRLNRLSEQHRSSRDYTLNSLRTAIGAVPACFPVYRTYLTEDVISPRDRGYVAHAASLAKRRNPALEASLFDFVRDTLLFEQPPDPGLRAREIRRAFGGRFQQASSAVMAKSVEDTAFYREFPLASVNEVGGAPAHAATTLDEFHDRNRERAARYPRSLTCTSTHDCKRSEDVRARIDLLSEIPGPWRKAVVRRARFNRRLSRTLPAGPAPSRNDEYLLYQTLVGVLPVTPAGSPEWSDLVPRLQGYMDKATHEAKLRTSWISPDPDYDAAVRDFVAAVLREEPGNRFLPDLRDFVGRIVDSGLCTALAQSFLKFASPGVPDLYQGQELWEFSLVDPDNRRPVDFDRRRWLLHEVRAKVAKPGPRAEFVAHLGRNPRDDRGKLLVAWTMLRLRAERPDLFFRGKYVPLAAEGGLAEHVVAFGWRSPDDGRLHSVAVAPRLLGRLSLVGTEPEMSFRPPLGEAAWGETALPLGEKVSELVDAFSGRRCRAPGGRVRLADALRTFPVAWLTIAK